MDSDNPSKERISSIRERIIELEIDRFMSIKLDLFKWVTGAALTINGAPLVVMLGSNELRPLLIGPGLVFAIGLACSVIGNLLLIKGFAHAGQVLLKSHWSGESVMVEDHDTVAPDSNGNGWSQSGAILMLCSIAAFLVGVFWSGLSLRSL